MLKSTPDDWPGAAVDGLRGLVDAGGDEVAGFAATPGALPAIGTISIAGIGATSKFGRLPGSILIPF